jgi:hypothetical protein
MPLERSGGRKGSRGKELVNMFLLCKDDEAREVGGVWRS